ncbi:hypothetical protein [Oceanicaulis sp. MMSF_3324]|uniref:hypothetical protein n=1 Tax=Oceanicaulis sp. MMSF_3324 TaxID=3046702 RepID=UPI00273FD850|nr:hypothetical protein [Oceanicaulis sp. MMSF_3324]
MIRILLGASALALSAALVSPLQAQAPAPAMDAFETGQWGAAETAAASVATDVDALLLASEAALMPITLDQADGMSRRERRQAALRAQEYAEAALELEPQNANAHLRLAAGLGYQSRYVNKLRAVMMGLPQRGRDHMVEAMRLDPSEPWAPAMLGAWHLEVVRRAGEGMFDANEAEGLSLMRQAVEMDGAPAAIPYRFAVALVAADPVAHADEAQALLNRALQTADSDAVGRAVSELATGLLALLETDPDAAQAEAVRLLEE